MNGDDPAGMRYRSLSKTSVQVRVEEDTTLDSETRHTTEVVSYLAIQGNGALTGKTYTPNGHSVTKYYYAGAQRIAMRVDGTLYYLLTDHLGSTSVTTDANGNKIAELRYKPCPLHCVPGMLREGEVRYAWGTTPTDYTYTGQRSEMASIGLMYYNARWGACPERSEGTPRWDASPRQIPSSPARAVPWRGTGMRMPTTIR